MALDDLLGLGFERAFLARMRVGDEVAHHRDAFDEFGEPLNEEHRERDHDQRLGRPLRQAAGISRLLVDLDRAQEERNAGHGHDDGQRQQEKRMTDRVDAVAQTLRQHVVHDVDADVLVVEQRPRRAQQEHDAEQHPLQLEPGIRRGIENLAHGGVGRRHHHGGEDQPRHALADPGVDGVDDARRWQQRLEHCVESAHLHLPSRWPASPAGDVIFVYFPTT